MGEEEFPGELEPGDKQMELEAAEPGIHQHNIEREKLQKKKKRNWNWGYNIFNSNYSQRCRLLFIIEQAILIMLIRETLIINNRRFLFGGAFFFFLCILKTRCVMADDTHWLFVQKFE